MKLRKLLKDKRYTNSFTELKSYAYQEYIKKPITLNTRERTLDIPLTEYFRECKYVSFALILKRNLDGTLSYVPDILSYNNNLAEFLNDTYNQSMRWTRNYGIFIATKDVIIRVSDNFSHTDFKKFNLTEDELNQVRIALMEIKLKK